MPGRPAECPDSRGSLDRRPGASEQPLRPTLSNPRARFAGGIHAAPRRRDVMNRLLAQTQPRVVALARYSDVPTPLAEAEEEHATSRASGGSFCCCAPAAISWPRAGFANCSATTGHSSFQERSRVGLDNGPVILRFRRSQKVKTAPRPRCRDIQQTRCFLIRLAKLRCSPDTCRSGLRRRPIPRSAPAAARRDAPATAASAGSSVRGTAPSPGRITVSNSRPFALWMVISCNRSPASALGCANSAFTCSRNHSKSAKSAPSASPSSRSK